MPKATASASYVFRLSRTSNVLEHGLAVFAVDRAVGQAAVALPIGIDASVPLEQGEGVARTVELQDAVRESGVVLTEGLQRRRRGRRGRAWRNSGIATRYFRVPGLLVTGLAVGYPGAVDPGARDQDSVLPFTA